MWSLPFCSRQPLELSPHPVEEPIARQRQESRRLASPGKDNAALSALPEVDQNGVHVLDWREAARVPRRHRQRVIDLLEFLAAGAVRRYEQADSENRGLLYWHLADIDAGADHVRSGVKRTWNGVVTTFVLLPLADIRAALNAGTGETSVRHSSSGGSSPLGGFGSITHGIEAISDMVFSSWRSRLWARSMRRSMT